MNVNDIVRERGNTYGHPADHFQRTVSILNALGFRRVNPNGEIRTLDALDWPFVMVADKLARLAESPEHRDGWADVQGYGKTAEMLLDVARLGPDRKVETFRPHKHS
jgi:hypothetical protein